MTRSLRATRASAQSLLAKLPSVEAAIAEAAKRVADHPVAGSMVAVEVAEQFSSLRDELLDTLGKLEGYCLLRETIDRIGLDDTLDLMCEWFGPAAVKSSLRKHRMRRLVDDDYRIVLAVAIAKEACGFADIRAACGKVAKLGGVPVHRDGPGSRSRYSLRVTETIRRRCAPYSLSDAYPGRDALEPYLRDWRESGLPFDQWFKLLLRIWNETPEGQFETTEARMPSAHT